LIFSGGTEIPVPEMPFLPGLTFKYKDKMVDQGKKQIIYTFAVIPSKPGSYVIGPLFTVNETELFRSNKVSLKVDRAYRPERISESTKNDSAGGSEKGLSGHIFTRMEIPDREVYVNEQIQLILKVYSDWLDVEELQIVETRSEGDLISTSFKKERSFFEENEGVKYIVLEYSKTIFSPFAGEITIPSFEVRFKIVRPEGNGNSSFLNDNSSFYEDYLGRKKDKREVLKTPVSKIKVSELPGTGPPGFKGALGDFNVSIKIDRMKFHKDRILEFITKITGEGNYNTVFAPELVSSEGVSIYSVEDHREEESIEFRQSVKLIKKNLKNIPALRFVFFSPSKKIYEIVEKGPFNIVPGTAVIDEIEKGKRSYNISGENEESWITVLKDDIGRIYGESYGIFSLNLVIVMFGLLLMMFGFGIYRYRLFWIMASNDPGAVFRRVSGISKKVLSRIRYLYKKGKSDEFCDALFQGLQDYFAELMGFSPGNITESAVKAFLKDNFELETLSAKINEIFFFCYRGKFSNINVDKNEMNKALIDTAGVFNVFNDIALELISARINGNR
jgi:hypothetical protein